MKQGYEKYSPFETVDLPKRQWPNNKTTKAPIWCSVDLRDGNQALVDPMNLEEKVEMFQVLVAMGFKEIEVGFPSASDTEYEILRKLIDDNLIPDDVTIQVLVQAREHLIRKTFDAVAGAKNVIIHFYNSTSALQRKVVFDKDMDGIIDIAVNAAKLIKTLTSEYEVGGTNIRYEYTPESFSTTEIENAIAICEAVMDELEPTPDNPIILNLPSTVESSTPNLYADQIEFFITTIKNRENALISLHPHNDRGTGVAAAELGLMAGAERLEGTLFGNGERTGNLDLVTVGLNLYTQGIDPELDFSSLTKVRKMYERVTKMHIAERHPYVGELVFTAFSGSHQDAINKGKEYMHEHKCDHWEIPYLPIDPADLGREYEPIIRINSQSGKGGAAFIMRTVFGYKLPKEMHPEFGVAIKSVCDSFGREISSDEVLETFEKEYLSTNGPIHMLSHKFTEVDTERNVSSPRVRFEGTLRDNGHDPVDVSATGTGPIDAFFHALSKLGIAGYKFEDYSEHSISDGSDAQAVTYIRLESPEGKTVYGVGTSHNVNYSSIRAVLSAVNRDITMKTKK